MIKYIIILEGKSCIIVLFRIGVRLTERIPWSFPNHIVVIIDKYASNKIYMFMVAYCDVW